MTPLDTAFTNSRNGGPSFPLRSRLLRAAWGLTWAMVGAWTPAPLHGWRRLLVRLFGGKIAPTAKIYDRVRIWNPANLQMDDYACLGPRVDCYSMAKIHLGPYALVSQDAQLCAGTHDYQNPQFQLIAKPITLEAEVWVAAGAFVGPGVTIHEGAVLGARSVAMKDLTAWTVHAGNPARALKARRETAGARGSAGA